VFDASLRSPSYVQVGPAAAWLTAAEHVAVYDHHSGVDGDIEYDELVIEPVGSATTVLVERLRERKIELTETEATLFALGIRADTGALSFPGTTPRDGSALVYLMESGLSQVAIAEFGQARLSATQRDLLATAMHDIQHVDHEGLKIGIVSLDTGRGFVTGMSAVAEELLQLMSFDVILLGITHENAKRQMFLSLIGRCSPRAGAVDLNVVMGTFSGGGHPAAAAASMRLGLLEPSAEVQPTAKAEVTAVAAGVKGKHPVPANAPAPAPPPALEAKADTRALQDEAHAALQEALEIVLSQVPTQVTAGELMTKTVFTCSTEDTMEEAMGLMNRMGKKAMPVTDAESKLCGMLKFRDVVKAAQTGKGGQQVKAWARRDVVTIPVEAPLRVIEEVLIETGTGRLLVTDEESNLLGLVTRTDVLRQHRMYGHLNKRVR